MDDETSINDNINVVCLSKANMDKSVKVYMQSIDLSTKELFKLAKKQFDEMMGG